MPPPGIPDWIYPSAVVVSTDPNRNRHGAWVITEVNCREMTITVGAEAVTSYPIIVTLEPGVSLDPAGSRSFIEQDAQEVALEWIWTGAWRTNEFWPAPPEAEVPRIAEPPLSEPPQVQDPPTVWDRIQRPV